MPPRRKPASAKAKKEELKTKRAIKRGDLPPPDKKTQVSRRGKAVRRGINGELLGSAGNADAIQAVVKLQSAFVTLPPHFLEQTKSLASTLPLTRPLSIGSAVIPDFAYGREGDAGEVKGIATELSCPRRPKWRFDMTKTEVEKNEEGVYKKWLFQMDDLVAQWQKEGDEPEPETNPDDEAPKANEPIPEVPLKMPRAPTYFERNIEVWRQLWRVTEISQIILVLLDSRCPLLHYPPSLADYLADRKKILVLTKVDIAGPVRAAAWAKYLEEHYPGTRVVQVESYIEKEASAAHQGRKAFQPHLPATFRERLVQTIRELHAEMLEPPERVKEKAERLTHWKPSVKREIDWEGVLKAGGGQVGSAVGGAAAPRVGDNENPDENTDHDSEPEFLTVGLIGQPNVGKSSLLNALFGTHKVRASKTPGKTKHFQTLFWTPDVRLVDCPGLVMPNFVPMEMQVLCGILPISRVSAVPSCTWHALNYIPIEVIHSLVHPILSVPVAEDKRTWRGGVRPGAEHEEQERRNPKWTAMDVLTAFADKKGWVTAKAGRPDVHRAGNALLRSMAEAKVGWAFWPPNTPEDTVLSIGEAGNGAWIPQIVVESDEEVEYESESEEEEKKLSPTSEGPEEESDEESDQESFSPPLKAARATSRFGALSVLDVDEGESEEDSSDDEEGEKKE